MFSFGDYSKLFYLIILVPVVFLLMYFRYKKIKQKYQAISVYKERFKDSLGFEFSSERYLISCLFLMLALILIVVSIAKPRIGYEWKEVKTTGSDIVVVLDLSKSMFCQDIKPSRLEVAKRKIKDLLSLLKGDRIGIVVFSGSSFVLCPLTQDYSVVDLFLESLDYGTLLVPGTSLDEALLSAISSLDESSYDGSLSKSVILITDGEDYGSNLDKVLQTAKEASVVVHTLGIGTSQGGPIPIESGGFQQDKSGKIVISKLNAEVLQKISDKTGGIAQLISLDGQEMDRIYYSGVLKQDQLQASKDRSKLKTSGISKEKVWNEKYGAFTGTAIVFIVLSFFIEQGGPRRTRKKSY